MTDGIKRQCRNCKYFRYGEQIVTDTYSGITDTYDGFCSFANRLGYPLTLVNTGSYCDRFGERGRTK